MMVLRTPKGWTGPKEVDGLPTEGTWRSHQVPLAEIASNPRASAPTGGVAAGATDQRNCSTTVGGWFRSWQRWLLRARGAWVRTRTRMADVLLRELRLPDFRDYAVDVPAPGRVIAEATRVLGGLLRDTMEASAEQRNFRIVAPDELASNRLGAVLEVDRPRLDG